ncbi:hypothetical protein MHYP_G00350880 [Metynnis hypsauchen]
MTHFPTAKEKKDGVREGQRLRKKGGAARQGKRGRQNSAEGVAERKGVLWLERNGQNAMIDSHSSSQ